MGHYKKGVFVPLGLFLYKGPKYIDRYLFYANVIKGNEVLKTNNSYHALAIL